MEQTAERIKREQDFHDRLSAKSFESRRLINRLSSSYYDKGERSRVWGPFWSSVDLSSTKVLDYGCGDGCFSSWLVSRGAEVTSIDISPELIALANRSALRDGPKPTFLVRDAHCTEFPSSSFDFVFGNGILHHLDVRLAYAEIARILRPGGRAVFMEPIEGSLFLKLFRLATPSARSIDEKPLSIADIQVAKTIFAHVYHREHFCLALAAAPVHLVNEPVARSCVRALDAFDQLVFKLIPIARRYAWLTLIDMQKSS